MQRRPAEDKPSSQWRNEACNRQGATGITFLFERPHALSTATFQGFACRPVPCVITGKPLAGVLGDGPETATDSLLLWLRLLRAACPYMVIYVTRPAPYLMRRPGVPVPVQWNRSARLFFTHCLSPSPHKQTITTSHCHQMNDKLT
ncbi:unnamed protein product [Boreogadus saida]